MPIHPILARLYFNDAHYTWKNPHAYLDVIARTECLCKALELSEDRLEERYFGFFTKKDLLEAITALWAVASSTEPTVRTKSKSIVAALSIGLTAKLMLTPEELAAIKTEREAAQANIQRFSDECPDVVKSIKRVTIDFLKRSTNRSKSKVTSKDVASLSQVYVLIASKGALTSGAAKLFSRRLDKDNNIMLISDR